VRSFALEQFAKTDISTLAREDDKPYSAWSYDARHGEAQQRDIAVGPMVR
jgi:hypothetical protein